jgi:hypothetical protein
MTKLGFARLDSECAVLIRQLIEHRSCSQVTERYACWSDKQSATVAVA